LIEVGSLRIRLPLAELEAASPKPVEKPRRVRSTTESRRDGSIEVDVRGMNAEDAWETVDRFVDSAVLTGWPQVRIIHGKGTGVLRRVIGERLLQDPRVVSHRLGQSGEGGDGVTVVWLEDEP
jgi:DNA mismatch repair protein MutS2